MRQVSLKGAQLQQDKKNQAKQRQFCEGTFEKYRFLCIVLLDQTDIDPRKLYCNRVEQIVNDLPGDEKLLIQARYMDPEEPTDYQVYTEVFNPPINPAKYAKIRRSALDKFYRAWHGLPQCIV
jgi:hypothetical protein